MFWRWLIVVGILAGVTGGIGFIVPCADRDYRALSRVAMTLLVVGVVCDLVGIWGSGGW